MKTVKPEFKSRPGETRPDPRTEKAPPQCPEYVGEGLRCTLDVGHGHYGSDCSVIPEIEPWRRLTRDEWGIREQTTKMRRSFQRQETILIG